MAPAAEVPVLGVALSVLVLLVEMMEREVRGRRPTVGRWSALNVMSTCIDRYAGDLDAPDAHYPCRIEGEMGRDAGLLSGEHVYARRGSTIGSLCLTGLSFVVLENTISETFRWIFPETSSLCLRVSRGRESRVWRSTLSMPRGSAGMWSR